MAPSPRSEESAIEPGRISSGRTRSSHEGASPSSIRRRSTSETKRATRRRLRGEASLIGALLGGGSVLRCTGLRAAHDISQDSVGLEAPARDAQGVTKLLGGLQIRALNAV